MSRACQGVQALSTIRELGSIPLNELDLSLHYHVGDNGLKILGEALPSLTSLTHVSVSWNYREKQLIWDNAKQANQALLDGMKLAMQLRKMDVADDAILQDFKTSSDAAGIYWQPTMDWLTRYGVIFWKSAKDRVRFAQFCSFCVNISQAWSSQIR